MAWWGKGDLGDGADSEAPSAQAAVRAVVFEPEPLDENAAPGKQAGRGRVVPDRHPAPDLEWVIVARTAPVAAVSRSALQTQFAEITEKFKDAPIEHMIPAMREALEARGREVPEDWILAIAEGLRRNGPTTLNLDGPTRA